jgi:histidine phosphotransfer protein HptB
MNEKILVQVDEDFADLIPDYLKKIKKEVMEKQQVLLQKGFNAILSWSHMIKSSGSGYGFDEIGKAGKIMETAAINQDESTIQTQLNNLAYFLEQVEPVYVEMEDV